MKTYIGTKIIQLNSYYNICEMSLLKHLIIKTIKLDLEGFQICFTATRLNHCKLQTFSNPVSMENRG